MHARISSQGEFQRSKLIEIVVMSFGLCPRSTNSCCNANRWPRGGTAPSNCQPVCLKMTIQSCSFSVISLPMMLRQIQRTELDYAPDPYFRMMYHPEVCLHD